MRKPKLAGLKRRHYEALAAIVKDNGKAVAHDIARFHVVQQIAHDLADAMQGANATFDRDKFIDACGVSHSNK